MPSLTPLHETYCKWDRTPPSQADLLEGIAQLVTTRLGDVVHDLIQAIQREILISLFGMNETSSKKFLSTRSIEKIYQFSFNTLQKYGSYLLAPSLRHIIEKFPNLHRKPLTPTMHYLVGAINGVLGDYLLKYHNPVALPMVFYDHYGAIQQGELSGRVVIMVHGLCMNHLYWSTARYGGIGEKLLAQRAQNTMLYLNYNTGRRISANGRSFANSLQDLLNRNPRISSIDLIGHSMGGLVSRSALFYGKQNMQSWIHVVENMVCIGSPHHGAALERFGFHLQDKLGRFLILSSPIKTVMPSVFCLRNLPSHDCLAFPRSQALRHYNSAVLHDNPKLHRLVAITLKFCLHLAQMAAQSALNSPIAHHRASNVH
jgi:pimeloyl-ACP methyl ester carboxylesterase